MAQGFTRPAGSIIKNSTVVSGGTSGRIPYETTNAVITDSSDLQFDGTDLIIGSGIRARMSGQNRFRHLNILCRANRTSSLTVANDTFTAVPLNAADTFDTDAVHDPSSSNTRLTVAIAGKYLACGRVQFGNNSTGRRGGRFAVSGVADSTAQLIGALTGGDTPVSFARILEVAASGYVELQCFQDSGGDLSLTNADIMLAYLGE